MNHCPARVPDESRIRSAPGTNDGRYIKYKSRGPCCTTSFTVRLFISEAGNRYLVTSPVYVDNPLFIAVISHEDVVYKRTIASAVDVDASIIMYMDKFTTAVQGTDVWVRCASPTPGEGADGAPPGVVVVTLNPRPDAWPAHYDCGNHLQRYIYLFSENTTRNNCLATSKTLPAKSVTTRRRRTRLCARRYVISRVAASRSRAPAQPYAVPFRRAPTATLNYDLTKSSEMYRSYEVGWMRTRRPEGKPNRLHPRDLNNINMVGYPRSIRYPMELVSRRQKANAPTRVRRAPACPSARRTVFITLARPVPRYTRELASRRESWPHKSLAQFVRPAAGVRLRSRAGRGPGADRRGPP
ncbi:hypothetical protein EVAR_92572_1 [Eumeta japonica]|uniref:Uncharacterized protein n=1 Tax=Eumeta variegata TaxID=151549 RepID=A0A4C1SWG5_EUMVA|nr:hypothetical protein EVAR_92572_1 [Eumeta japonica]